MFLISSAKVLPVSETDVSLTGKDVSNLGFVLFLLCYLPILATRHTVGIAEKTGKGGATGDA